MRFIILFVTLSCSITVMAQSSCNCIDVFSKVVQKLQINYIGYIDKITPNTKEFARITDSVQHAVNKANPIQCLTLINRWIAFFKDGHVSLRVNDELSKDSIRLLFQNAEQAPVTEADFKKYIDTHTGQLDSLEGIWEDDAKTYRFAVMRDGHKANRFTGFVLKADSVYWMPGQVKFKMEKTGKQYRMIYFNSIYHVPGAAPVQVTQRLMRLHLPLSIYNLNKSYPGKASNVAAVVKSRNPSFAILDSNTCLLTIPSAGTFIYKHEIDSMLNRFDAVIKRTPHLIIDVRNNLGGTETCFDNVMPLLYTRPVTSPWSLVLSTPDNINEVYAVTDYPGVSDSLKKVFIQWADSLRAHINTTYELLPVTTEVRKTIFPYPQKVSILINEYCASSTEIFLQRARQSDKVKLYGHHTLGAFDYSDANSSKVAGCNWYKLRYSTSRTGTAFSEPIDGKGFQPDVVIEDDAIDWIEYVRSLPLK
jgi:hypothetical protein